MALLALVIGGVALLVSVAAAVGLSGRSGSSGNVRAGYAGSVPPAAMELPAFELRSYRGRPVVDDELRGSVVLVTLLDSQCTEACPVIAWSIARALDALTPMEREQVRAIALTTDPDEDTPASVGEFLRAQRAEGRLDYLLGTERELRPIWEAMKVLPSLDTGKDTLHSAPLRIYDREGLWVSTLHAGADLTHRNLLHDIRRALSGTSS